MFSQSWQIREFMACIYTFISMVIHTCILLYIHNVKDFLYKVTHSICLLKIASVVQM